MSITDRLTLSDGVCTGNIVIDAEGNRSIVVGFLTTHPDSDEVKMSWPGGGLQKDDGPWPPGGRLTAENISMEVQYAKEKFRGQVRAAQGRAASALKTALGIEIEEEQ